MKEFQEIQFTVDSELLRELGERLVGRPYIALAELVKNSFDADATNVTIRIDDDRIEVADNGHGMTFADFEGRWMRVGSTHKVDEINSPELQRPMTGSKGVGRLAVQFLASELNLISVPKPTRVPEDSSVEELYVLVDWETARKAGDLTNATALYDRFEFRNTEFPCGMPHGTKVILSNLKHDWTPGEFESLAREIWFLQPPFRSLVPTNGEGQGDFRVDLLSTDPELDTRFSSQMGRMLDLYESRLVGKLMPYDASGKDAGQRHVRLSLQLEDERPQSYRYDVPVSDGKACLIDSLEFEIRIFKLVGRQAFGIPVRVARNYMARWGGVHIYDAGFRIPYAGADSDWLRLEFDHSHRLTTSQLLPAELNVPLGLNHLPTNSRVLGVVSIDTAHEIRMSEKDETFKNEHLQIQVSRDRLVDNESLRQLRDVVRFALDYYATRLAALRLQQEADKREREGGVENPASLVENVWDVLEQHESDIPGPVVSRIKSELRRTIETVRQQSEWTRSQSGLLGAMATVGATAAAFDHQFNQQLNTLAHHVSRLGNVSSKASESQAELAEISEEIRQWIRDAQETRAIFSPITDDRDRTAFGRFTAKSVVERMARNMRPILRGVDVDVFGINPELRLPETSYPVWMAIFNNLFLNASNAMLDRRVKRIHVSSFESHRRRGIHVQDTGIGIDLKEAEGLFEPLKRGLEISPERRALGYGGTGLGLAIVRMLALDLNAEVRFVQPTSPFKTCFELAWSEAP